MQSMTCPYCKRPAMLVSANVVYGRQVKDLTEDDKRYWCQTCDAHVGCHKGTDRPLGTMANRRLRSIRSTTHSLVDPLWQSGKIKRNKLYFMLSVIFGRPFHVGECDESECWFVINLLKRHLELTHRGRQTYGKNQTTDSNR